MSEAYAQARPERKKKTPAWVWVVIISAAVIALIAALGWAVSNKFSTDGGLLPGNGEDYVAVVHIEGTIAEQSYGDGYDHAYLLDLLEELRDDPQNLGLLLYIDSPGGEVQATDELGEAIVEYKEITGRPVYAYGHGYAASGAYWIAAAADRIYLDRYCISGSIGVTFGAMFDFSGLLERYGVRVVTITSGEQKAMGSGWQEMSEETRAIYQAIIDEYYGYFLDWVSLQRGLERERVQALADGRIYTASQCVENGLADRVGDFDDCLADLLQQVGGEAEVQEFRPESVVDLFSLLGQAQTDSELERLLTLLPPSGPLAYYQ